MKEQLKNIFTILLIFTAFNSKAQKSIDEIVDSYMSTNKIPGVSLAIIQNDSVKTSKGYGFSSVQNEMSVDVNTTFELASLTKHFTATAILKLQQNEKLNVNDYLHQYFPECPDHWKTISIKHLLWHTSGLPGMFPHDNFTQKSFTGYSKMTVEELDEMMQTNTVSKEIAIKSIITDSLDFEPGSAYNYSDVGYLLLGIIIDNITNSYRNYLSDIFNQLDMPNTYLIDQQRVVKNQARGYSLRNGELINIMRTWDYEIPSHFGVFSNVQDLIKWHYIINNSDFLNEPNRKFLYTKGQRTDNSTIPYGCGWEINDINGLKFISHTGVTGTIIVSIPQKNTTVILLTNLGYNGNDFVNSWNLAYELINSLGIETKINRFHITSNGLKQIKTTKGALKKIIGSYTTVDNSEVNIYENNGIGFFENQGNIYQLSLLEDGTWIVLGYDYEYILTLDKSGQILKTNYGREFKKK